MVLVGVVFDHTQQGSVQSGGLLSLGLVVGFLKNGQLTRGGGPRPLGPQRVTGLSSHCSSPAHCSQRYLQERGNG